MDMLEGILGGQKQGQGQGGLPGLPGLPLPPPLQALFGGNGNGTWGYGGGNSQDQKDAGPSTQEIMNMLHTIKAGQE